jgi:hypothetical protein
VKLTVVSPSRLLVAAAFAAAVVLSVRIGVDADALLCLAPALVLMAALLARRYPGERLLMSLAAERRPRRTRAAASSRRLGVRGFARVPRGGLLLGCALAVRPPPVSLAR